MPLTSLPTTSAAAIAAGVSLTADALFTNRLLNQMSNTEDWTFKLRLHQIRDWQLTHKNGAILQVASSWFSYDVTEVYFALPLRDNEEKTASDGVTFKWAYRRKLRKKAKELIFAIIELKSSCLKAEFFTRANQYFEDNHVATGEDT